MKTYTVDFTEDELAFLVGFHGMNSHADWNAILRVDNHYRGNDKIEMYEFLTTKGNSHILYLKMKDSFVENFKTTELFDEHLRKLWIGAVNNRDTELSFREWAKNSVKPSSITTRFGKVEL